MRYKRKIMKKILVVLILTFAIMLTMASCNFVDGIKDVIIDNIFDKDYRGGIIHE